MALTRRTFLRLAPTAASIPAFAGERGLSTTCSAYERATGGRIGVFARNVSNGRTLAWREDDRFVMCSTFKASLAALVLARVDAGLERLDDLVAFGQDDLQPYAPVARAHLAEGRLSVDALCAGSVELSDNTCANLLLARCGGPAALTAFWRSLGDDASRLDHDEPLLNRTPPGLEDTTTPRAMAGDLQRLLLGDALSVTSRAKLTDWLIRCTTGADRLRAGLPAGWKVGDKTGNNGADAFGDLAVTWPGGSGPIVICAYTRGGAPDAGRVAIAFREIGAIAAGRLA